MKIRLVAALVAGALLLGFDATAWAQGCGDQNPNCIVPTAPAGTSNNQAASTAFVQQNAAPLALPSGDLFVGNASNQAVAQALSGDCTITNAGAITCLKTNGSSFGSAATQNTGTSGATIPLLNGSNTFSGLANFTSTFQISGNAITWPGSATTVAALNITDQTLTGGANVTSNNLGTVSSGTTTIDCGARPLQFLTNNGAFTLAAPSNDGSCVVLVTNGASAGTITFSGFSVGSNTGDTYATTNTNKYSLSVWRINSVAGYRWAAHQ